MNVLGILRISENVYPQIYIINICLCVYSRVPRIQYRLYVLPRNHFYKVAKDIENLFETLN